LNTSSPASSIANVVWLTRRETALGYNATDVALCELTPNAKLQVGIEATNLDLGSLSQTAMNRNDVVAHREQLQAPRFVEAAAGEMQRGEVPRLSDAFEQVKMKVVGCNRPRNI